MLLLAIAHGQSLIASDNPDSPLMIFIYLGLTIFGLVFFLPTIVAFKRKHPNRFLILVINVLAGWTGIAWLVALIWAMNKVHISPTGSSGGESGVNLFVNDEKKVRIVGHSPPRG